MAAREITLFGKTLQYRYTWIDLFLKKVDGVVTLFVTIEEEAGDDNEFGYSSHVAYTIENVDDFSKVYYEIKAIAGSFMTKEDNEEAVNLFLTSGHGLRAAFAAA